MPEVYVAKDGDMVDEICWRFYAAGQQPLSVERVYSENQGLAELGPVLPAGTQVTLPDLPEPESTPLIRIWD